MASTLKHVRTGRRRRFSRTSLFSKATSCGWTSTGLGSQEMRRTQNSLAGGSTGGQVANFLRSISAPSNDDEQATLVPERPNPPNLRQPPLKAPVVPRASKQFL